MCSWCGVGIPQNVSIIRIVAVDHAGGLKKPFIQAFFSNTHFYCFAAFGAAPLEMGSLCIWIKPHVGIAPDEVNPDELLARSSRLFLRSGHLILESAESSFAQILNGVFA